LQNQPVERTADRRRSPATFGSKHLFVMSETFPEPILRLPIADIPIPGLSARLSESEGHQILFMRFSQDADIPEHSHESQWGVVLTGRIDLTIAGQLSRLQKGDQYFIPASVKHSAKIYAGYSDITFFDAPARYRRIAR
jgi:mannose-6-phosphate isomerase-like protein (cupin superfamily)